MNYCLVCRSVLFFLWVKLYHNNPSHYLQRVHCEWSFSVPASPIQLHSNLLNAWKKWNYNLLKNYEPANKCYPQPSLPHLQASQHRGFLHIQHLHETAALQYHLKTVSSLFLDISWKNWKITTMSNKQLILIIHLNLIIILASPW